MDKFKIETRILPIDPSQQEALSQAVAAGLLNPQDPRVQRKALELYHLPTELDSQYMDNKVQWKEIETMKQTGQQVQPMLIRDNDAAHIEVCRVWMNSDEGMDPQNQMILQIVLQHCQLHMMNMAKSQMMQAAVAGAGQEVAGMTGGQPGQPGQGGPQGQPGKKPEGQKGAQAGKHGGQSPQNPVKRQQRAQKGQAAKPHRPQPSEGNQHHIQRLT